MRTSITQLFEDYLRCNPTLDIVRVQDVGLLGKDAPTILECNTVAVNSEQLPLDPPNPRQSPQRGEPPHSAGSP